MKIELNTEDTSGDALYHLGMMLVALSGKAENSMVAQSPSTQQSSSYQSQPSSGGLMGMFGSSEPEPAPTPEPEPSTASLVNLFNDPTPSQPASNQYSESQPTQYSEPTQSTPQTNSEDMISLFKDDSASLVLDGDDKEKQHDASDLRIVPY